MFPAADSIPKPAPASVSVRGIAKRYGAVEALKGASFEVAAGEVFGLLGPNGAGKTTALECILGLRRPDSGAISVAGIDALARPLDAKRLIGAQIQAATLQDKVTPRRALRLFGSFYSASIGAEELLERFGLSGKADASFDSLSGGQRQRLFLALAFVNNPALVVLDEPTAGLDPRSRCELHDIIAGIRESGRTVLLSTHDLDEAQHLCDTVAILDKGRIVAAARPRELIAVAGANSTLAVTTALPLAASELGALPGVTESRQKDGGWLLATGDLNGTIVALVKLVEFRGNELLDLRVLRPSLEDVFLSLTGRAWSGRPKEGE